MPSASLHLAGIKVIRSGRCILDIDSLHVLPHQFVNIIGTNGAGKTTLLKLLSGQLKPSAGSLMFDDKPITAMSAWKRTNLKKQIGYIPQSAEYNANLPFTVREVVSMGITSANPLFYRFSKNDHDLVDHWIDKVNLWVQKNQTFRTLSGGEQQKVLIARAMVQNPTVLMLDEPTSNLDFHWKGKIRRLVKDLQQQLKLTVLMISHELASIPVDSDRAILLHAGKIIADHDTEQVLTSDKIQQVYKCKIRIQQVNENKYIINEDIEQ